MQSEFKDNTGKTNFYLQLGIKKKIQTLLNRVDKAYTKSKAEI